MEIKRKLVLTLTLTSLVFFTACDLFLNNPEDFAFQNQDESGEFPDLEEVEAFFDPGALHHFTITMSESEWYGLSEDVWIYDAQFGSRRTGNYRRAQVEYQGPLGQFSWDDVGIRTRGNTSRRAPLDQPVELDTTPSPAHFALKWDETFDLLPGTLAYDTLNDRRFIHQKMLNFKYPNGDPTFVKELYQYNFLNEAGAMAPQATSAILTIEVTGDNPRTYNYGYYNVMEAVKKPFLTARLGRSRNDGDIYKCLWQANGPATLVWDTDFLGRVGEKDWTSNYRPSYNRDTGPDNPDFMNLNDLAYSLSTSSGQERIGYLDENVNVESVLRYMAANQLLGMPDDYWAMGNNYYLYFENDGPMHFIPYDYDQGLEPTSWAEDPTNASIYQWFNFSYIDSAERPLIDGILENPVWVTRYEELIAELLDPESGSFSYENFETFFLEKQAQVQNGEENFLQGSIYGGNMYLPSSIETYFNERADFVRDELGLEVTTEGPAQFSLEPGAGFVEPETDLWVLQVDETTDNSGFTHALELVISQSGDYEINFSMAVETDPGDGFVDRSGSEYTDTASPFEYSWTGESFAAFRYLIRAEVVENGSVIEQVDLVVFGQNTGYESIQDHGDGTVTFRVRPSSFVYGGESPSAVTLRGAPWNWLVGESMVYNSTDDLWEVTVEADSGEPYKYHFADSNRWVTDRHNYKVQDDGNYNSLVP